MSFSACPFMSIQLAKKPISQIWKLILAHRFPSATTNMSTVFYIITVFHIDMLYPVIHLIMQQVTTYYPAVDASAIWS